jgi:hypothetical protein
MTNRDRENRSGQGNFDKNRSGGQQGGRRDRTSSVDTEDTEADDTTE